MPGTYRIILAALMGVVITACKSTPEQPAPATTADYPQCQSQSPAEPKQRAPSFLSEMADCRAQVSERAATLGQQVGAGKVGEAGECAFDNGMSCHYHGGREFLADANAQQEPGVGELHCIIPGDVPTSPTVFGAHIRCREGTAASATATGGQCQSGLLEVFSTCQSWRCCDDGSLTMQVAKMSAEQQALQPDFRICANQVLEIDCSMLAPLTAWTLYTPAQGGVVEPVFDPATQQ